MSASQITAATRVMLAARSQGWCELCAAEPATQAHHRDPRGMGGTSVRGRHLPAYLLHLGNRCHARVEHERTWALAERLLLVSGTDPETAPVRLRHPVYGPAWWRLLHTEAALVWEDVFDADAPPCTPVLDRPV